MIKALRNYLGIRIIRFGERVMGLSYYARGEIAIAIKRELGSFHF